LKKKKPKPKLAFDYIESTVLCLLLSAMSVINIWAQIKIVYLLVWTLKISLFLVLLEYKLEESHSLRKVSHILKEVLVEWNKIASVPSNISRS
jgi:hypothetical protein